MSDKSDVQYPEVFITGKLDESRDDCDICADALVGWACCYMKSPPENFGHGMAAIGKKLGIAPIGKYLEEYAREKDWLK